MSESPWLLAGSWWRGCCAYCDEPADLLDHVLPRAHGGTEGVENLVPACKGCNSAKGKQLVEHFLSERPEALRRIRHYREHAREWLLNPPTETAPPLQCKPMVDRRTMFTTRLREMAIARLTSAARITRRTKQDLVDEGVDLVLAKYGF